MSYKLEMSTINIKYDTKGLKLKSPFKGAILSPLGRFNLEPRSTAGVELVNGFVNYLLASFWENNE